MATVWLTISVDVDQSELDTTARTLQNPAAQTEIEQAIGLVLLGVSVNSLAEVSKVEVYEDD